MKKYLVLSVLSINLICIGTASSTGTTATTRATHFQSQRAEIADNPTKKNNFISGKPVSVNSFNSGAATVQCTGYRQSSSEKKISGGDEVTTTRSCSTLTFTNGSRQLTSSYPTSSASSTTTKTTVNGQTTTKTTGTLWGVQQKGSLTTEENKALNDKAFGPNFKVETTY